MDKKKLIENIHTKVKFLEKDLKKLKTLEEVKEMVWERNPKDDLYMGEDDQIKSWKHSKTGDKLDIAPSDNDKWMIVPNDGDMDYSKMEKKTKAFNDLYDSMEEGIEVLKSLFKMFPKGLSK